MSTRYSSKGRRNSEVSSSSLQRSASIKGRINMRKYQNSRSRSITRTRTRRSPSPIRKSPRGNLRSRYRRSSSQRSYTPDSHLKTIPNGRKQSPGDFSGKTDPVLTQKHSRATFESYRHERDRTGPFNGYISPDKRYRNYYDKTWKKPEENKSNFAPEKKSTKFESNSTAHLNDKTLAKNTPNESFGDTTAANTYHQKLTPHIDRQNTRTLNIKQGAWKRPFNQSTVDRTSTSPFLLRVFLKIKGEHQLSDFAIRSKEPIQDELQLYFWMDTTLRELVDLVKDVSLESRNRNSYWKFRVIYQDKQGKTAMNEVGTIHSTRIDPWIDNRTLQQIKFQIGDYIDISINTGKKQIDFKNDKAEETALEIPKSSEDNENSLQDENKLIPI